MKCWNQTWNLLQFKINLVLCMCVLFYSSFVCISAYANVYFQTTIIKQNIKLILIAGVPSSQALPGFLITAPPSACVPAASCVDSKKKKKESARLLGESCWQQKIEGQLGPGWPSKSNCYVPTNSNCYLPTNSNCYVPTNSNCYAPTNSNCYLPTNSNCYLPCTCCNFVACILRLPLLWISHSWDVCQHNIFSTAV